MGLGLLLATGDRGMKAKEAVKTKRNLKRFKKTVALVLFFVCLSFSFVLVFVSFALVLVIYCFGFCCFWLFSQAAPSSVQMPSFCRRKPPLRRALAARKMAKFWGAFDEHVFFW